MLNKRLIILFIACLSFVSSGTLACAGHMYIDDSKLGFFGGAMARMAGLTPPAPIFELEHPAMLKATIGEASNFEVTYSRPFFSKNVSMELSGTNNVKLTQEKVLLEDRDGTINIPFEVSGSGFDSIILTVRGEHKGELVMQRAQIYVRATAKPSKPELQVSNR